MKIFLGFENYSCKVQDVEWHISCLYSFFLVKTTGHEAKARKEVQLYVWSFAFLEEMFCSLLCFVQFHVWFDQALPKIIESTFTFPEFVQACKKTVYQRQQILESGDQTGHINFWPCPPKKIFDNLLIFVNLYQHAKNQFIPSVHSSDTVNFKV